METFTDMACANKKVPATEFFQLMSDPLWLVADKARHLSQDMNKAIQKEEERLACLEDCGTSFQNCTALQQGLFLSASERVP